jgi:uncharacterized membrane protein YvbJ
VFCKHCGFQVPGDSVFCEKCGKDLSKIEENGTSESNQVDLRIKRIKKWVYINFGFTSFVFLILFIASISLVISSKSFSSYLIPILSITIYTIFIYLPICHFRNYYYLCYYLFGDIHVCEYNYCFIITFLI